MICARTEISALECNLQVSFSQWAKKLFSISTFQLNENLSTTNWSVMNREGWKEEKNVEKCSDHVCEEPIGAALEVQFTSERVYRNDEWTESRSRNYSENKKLSVTGLFRQRSYPVCFAENPPFKKDFTEMKSTRARETDRRRTNRNGESRVR